MMVEQLHCIVREDQKPNVVASCKLMVNELLDLMAWCQREPGGLTPEGGYLLMGVFTEGLLQRETVSHMHIIS